MYPNQKGISAISAKSMYKMKVEDVEDIAVSTLLVVGFQRNTLEYVWVAEDIAPSNNYCILYTLFFLAHLPHTPLLPLN